MKPFVACLTAVLLVMPALAADQPSMSPPADWRGVKFGAKRVDAENQIKAAFSDMRREGNVTTKARASVAGEDVDVQFLFGDVSKTLCWVAYSLAKTPLDSVISAFEAKFGTRTSDTTFIVAEEPIRYVQWQWKDPFFEIIVTAGRDLYGTYHVSVCYAKKESFLESNLKKNNTPKKQFNNGY